LILRAIKTAELRSVSTPTAAGDSYNARVSRQQHWESVYESEGDAEVSWTQAEPQMSLYVIRDVCPSGRISDVGGGTSLLAELLLDAGYSVAVLDISAAALARARVRISDICNFHCRSRFYVRIVREVVGVREAGRECDVISPHLQYS
jgi:SAM-dependent methyltransferase